MQNQQMEYSKQLSCLQSLKTKQSIKLKSKKSRMSKVRKTNSKSKLAGTYHERALQTKHLNQQKDVFVSVNKKSFMIELINLL